VLLEVVLRNLAHLGHESPQPLRVEEVPIQTPQPPGKNKNKNKNHTRQEKNTLYIPPVTVADGFTHEIDPSFFPSEIPKKPKIKPIKTKKKPNWKMQLL
jgi:hypothetical protein